MLPVITAVVSSTAPAERDYRVTLRATPAAEVTLRARAPQGWIVAFCTPSVCALRHVTIHVPQSGRSTIALHVYRVQDSAARHDQIVVSADGHSSLTLPLSF